MQQFFKKYTWTAFEWSLECRLTTAVNLVVCGRWDCWHCSLQEGEQLSADMGCIRLIDCCRIWALLDVDLQVERQESVASTHRLIRKRSRKEEKEALPGMGFAACCHQQGCCHHQSACP